MAYAQRHSSTPSKAKRSEVRNWGALSHWKRKKSMESRIDEVRVWELRCPGCEHEGFVTVSLRRLRASNLICSQCSRPLWRNRST